MVTTLTKSDHNSPGSWHVYRQRIFVYGPWHALGFTFLLGLGVNLFRSSFQFFLIPMAEEFNVGRREISSAAASFLLLIGLLNPVVGWLLDRIGVRKVMVAGAFILSVAALALAFAKTALQLKLAYGFLGALAAISVIGSPSQFYISQWFQQRRAFALAIISNTNAVGMFLVAPVMAIASVRLSWHLWYLMLAGVFFLILVPVVFMGIRPCPWQNIDRDIELIRNLPREKISFRTTAIFVAFFTCGFTMGIVDTHLVPMMHDHHLSGGTIGGLMSFWGICLALGGLASGWISDWLQKRYLVLSWLFFLRMASLVIFLLPANSWQFFLFNLLFGLSYTGVIPIGVAALSEEYGHHRLGIHLGVAILVHQVGGFISSYCGALCRDQMGSYQFILMMALALCLFAALFLMMAHWFSVDFEKRKK